MKKNKHDHKGTKALKLSIFFTLMLAPFLAVLFKCAYVTFNKNAKDSYYGETINEAQFTAISNNEVEQNKLVRYTSTNLSTLFSQNSSITINHLDNIQLTDGTSQTEILNANKDNINLLVFANNGTTNPYISFRNGNDTILNLALQTRFTQFDFIPTTTQNVVSDVASLLEYVTFNKDSYLDNAFYYAIDEAMESPYFAWARTSALYTATSGLTNGMGITTQAIPTLIVYWLILTAIYIIIDIVVESFTYITHCIMNRFE